MQDDFLKAFAEQRKLRADADRTFRIDENDETTALTYRPAVAPEVPLAFQQATDLLAGWANDVNDLLAAANGSTPTIPEQPISEAELLAVYDATVIACLEEQSHATWARLRSPEASHPLLGEEVYRLAVYLIGKTTSLPTDGLLGSSSTQPETATTSTGNSRSPVPARTRSEPSSPLPTPS